MSGSCLWKQTFDSITCSSDIPSRTTLAVCDKCCSMRGCCPLHCCQITPSGETNDRTKIRLATTPTCQTCSDLWRFHLLCNDGFCPDRPTIFYRDGNLA